MEKTTPWTLLRAGEDEQSRGLHQIQEAHARERSGSTIMELGVAHLWLSQYQQAWEHFREAIEKFPQKGDAFYGMAGVAKWCLGKASEAVSEWRSGLDAKYARASGLGIRMPLLLFFTAVRQPKVFDRKVAEKFLQEKTLDIRIRNWPGPITRLVLDQVNEAEFKNHCLGVKADDAGKNPFLRHSPKEASNCLWLGEFYKNVLALEQGALSDFQNSMRKLSDTSQSEWQDEDVFVSRLWHEEFFIARYEAAIAIKGQS